MKKLHLLLLFVVTACSLVVPEISVLDNPVCNLPCWNGITPGQTSQPDALQIVTSLDGIDQKKTNVLNVPWLIFNKQIWFYLYTNPSLGGVQTDGAIYFIDNKVATVILRRNIGKTFGDMVELVGEPETIISMTLVEGGIVVLAIIPSKGVEFEFYTKSNERFGPETQIDNVMFFNSIQYEQLLDAGMFSLGIYNANEIRKIMYQWKGYGNIEELYPPRFP